MIIRNTKEFVNLIKEKKVLSIDFGKKKVGLAISNTCHTITSPLKNLNRNSFFHRKILDIIEDYEIGGILIGLPLNEDKSLNKISQFILDISKNMDFYLLNNKINLPLFFWDENFSSFEAELLVYEFNKGKRVDKFAAKVFLDDFFRENNKHNEKKKK